MTACFVAEFSCCVPRCCNVVMDILLCYDPAAKTETHFTWTVAGYITIKID